MKNNELLITLKFEKDSYEMTFVVDNDISLRNLLEAIFYGLRENKDSHFEEFRQFTKTHREIAVLYKTDNEKFLINVKDNLDKNLFELGIVTTSCVVIPKSNNIVRKSLFVEECKNMVSLRDSKKLEYNISTRRIAAAESSVIDIIPSGEMPGGQRRGFLDVIVPTSISMGTLFLGRWIMSIFNDNASGFPMLAMMMTTSVSTMVTQLYNYVKQGKDNKKTIEEWKSNYEQYLSRTWNKIIEWQKSDINYLRTNYPEIAILFSRVAYLDRAIFARSQNDSDFMKISLGISKNVEPMFEISSEQKDEIISNVGFHILTEEEKKENDKLPPIQIILPPKDSNKLKKIILHLKNKSDNPVLQNSDGSLTDLPYYLSTKTFQYLKAEKNENLPPLVIDLKNCGALGIVESKEEVTIEEEKKEEKKKEKYPYSSKFVQHIIFELSYYHTPEDVQFVFFFEEENDYNKREQIIHNYKYLPHANELFGDTSQFVFDNTSASIVFSKLQSIMNERTKQRQEEENDNVNGEQLTQIVCIVFCDYNIKETGFSKYLPKPPVEGEDYVNRNGLTFIFVCEHLAKLPPYCGHIIEINKNNDMDAKLSNRYNVLKRETLNELSSKQEIKTEDSNSLENLIYYKEFQNPRIFYSEEAKNGEKIKLEYEEAFRRISAIYYRRIAENGNVPSLVTLFKLHDFKPTMIEDNKISEIITENWKKSDVTKSLSVPIGMNEHGVVELNLHEKADGPHMLVAGTTGSGKSETIITYLIGLCMKYSPSDLNLMLVDMKGGGFSDRMRDLPHCVGVVDDTSGESEGISATYMLKRFLEVLNAEIKTRKLLLKSFSVSDIDGYIKIEKLINKLIDSDSETSEYKKIFNSLKKEQQDLLNKFRESNTRPEKLSHLVLVVDEFTELKRFSNESDDVDFISEITTIARIGRTLGFHIILVSQNIEGAITDDIRINSKSRICLKVATRAASKEMLDGRTDAASPTMPGNGRAYLLVGTGSKFLYFQSGFTGANKDESGEKPISMKLVQSCGKHNSEYYKSTVHNERIKRSGKKQQHNDTQLLYVVNTIKEIKKSNADGKEKIFEMPRIIFNQPLSTYYKDETEWRM